MNKGKRNVFRFTEMNPSIAYLLGVYYGDGYARHCPSKRNWNFCHKGISYEFLQETQRHFQILFGKSPKIQVDGKYFNNRRQCWRTKLTIEVASKDFVSWLFEYTGRKSKWPDDADNWSLENKKWFCVGFFSSEGCVEGHKPGKQTNHVHVDCTLPFMDKIHRLFDDIGLRTSKLGTYLSGHGTLVYKFYITGRSLWDFPVFVASKKQKIDEHRHYIESQPQRLQMGRLRPIRTRQMIKSDPNSDVRAELMLCSS